MNDAITPFTLAVPQADLEDLNRRTDQTRWPDAETVDDWTQGTPLAKVKALVDHWRHRYDWRHCEAVLNNWSQYKITIDGLDIQPPGSSQRCTPRRFATASPRCADLG